MCLIVFAWRPGHAVPLLVAANRDEFYARPSAALAHWDEQPGIYAGRDLQAGGTWLGVGPHGRFAALTNLRDPAQPLGARSRGELPAGFLSSQSPPSEFLAELQSHACEFSGFNLLVGSAEQLWHYNPRTGAPRQLAAGVYGVSNASLDTPWPKLLRAKSALAEALASEQEEALFSLLTDRQIAADADLPQTGIGPEFERLLSSAFICSSSYGTRACTVLKVMANGERLLIERSFGPNGVALGETRFVLDAAK
ncbi:MAG: NRDE family protein [Pseudomonas sp.]|uniref:NRDE family protein n=1 Tax=Pseudomonas sp. TaxID=306 RepID=UPI0027225EA2|nr:NRDE family protein [Pseudomonas sp.]